MEINKMGFPIFLKKKIDLNPGPQPNLKIWHTHNFFLLKYEYFEIHTQKPVERYSGGSRHLPHPVY